MEDWKAAQAVEIIALDHGFVKKGWMRRGYSEDGKDSWILTEEGIAEFEKINRRLRRENPSGSLIVKPGLIARKYGYTNNITIQLT